MVVTVIYEIEWFIDTNPRMQDWKSELVWL